MGVDFSTTVCFGVLLDKNETPKALKHLRDDWGHIENYELDGWLTLHGYDLLSADTVGNYMDGDTRDLIRIKDVGLRFDIYGDADSGVHELDTTNVPSEGLKQLNQLSASLDLENRPTWIVAFNIS